MDPKKRSLGRNFFIMAKSQGKSPKKPQQDQSREARERRRKAREAVKKAQGKSRYSQTYGDK